MNKSFRKILVFIAILSLVSLDFNEVKCEESYSNTNIKELATKERNEFMGDIIYALLNNDNELLNDYKNFFEESCLSEFNEYITYNKVYGTLIESNIEYIDKEYSYTNDDVIMCNIKITHINTNNNLVYLLEMHINKDGKIYGYNIWAY